MDILESEFARPRFGEGLRDTRPPWDAAAGGGEMERRARRRGGLTLVRLGREGLAWRRGGYCAREERRS